jgi:hypothetical protein
MHGYHPGYRLLGEHLPPQDGAGPPGGAPNMASEHQTFVKMSWSIINPRLLVVDCTDEYGFTECRSNVPPTLVAASER